MNYKNVPVNERPGFIAAGKYHLYSSRASMQAFAAATMDRIAWRNGSATEQHIPEPSDVAHLDLGSRWHPWD